MGKEQRTRKHIKARHRKKDREINCARDALLRKFDRASKLEKTNNITSINPNNLQQSSLLSNNNNNLCNLRGSGSDHRQELSERLRISKLAPYSTLPLAYNVCKRTTNMNALQMFNYMQALKNEHGGSKGLKGRGLLKTDPNTQDMLGSNAPSNNQEYSNTPTMSGSRSLGDAQPGSEKIKF